MNWLKLRKTSPLDLEYFIHGGMCASFSGRCVLSNYMTGRDANRGGCAHSCRWNYRLFKNHHRITRCYFSMGSKDLMVLRFLPQLIDLKIASVKIEGRMKSTYYLATVVKTYRQLIDRYEQKGSLTEEDYEYFTLEMEKAENRMTGRGFYTGLPTQNEQLYDHRSEHPTKEFIGVVLAYDEKTKIALIEQRNYFKVGDEVEFFGPTLDNHRMIISSIVDKETGEFLEVARHPLQVLEIPVDVALKPYDMMRLVLK